MKKSLEPNTFAMPSPVWVIGTYGDDDVPNIMTAAWAGICCGMPPCVAVSLQKTRASYENIIKHKAFTVNIPSTKQVAEADYVGIFSGKKVDKFKAAHLTAIKSDVVAAPYVDEFPLVLECRLVNTIELGIHTQFVGEIISIKAEENVLNEQGLPALEKVDPFVFSSSDKMYYKISGELAKPFSVGMKFKK
jgi:flavin reductase (DIM6/NTAB) family NADH-FMN oxidoreductase RutF